MTHQPSRPPLHLAPPNTLMEQEDLGVLKLKSAEPLGPYPDRIGSFLGHWATEAADRTFLAERGPVDGELAGDWLRLSYREVYKTVQQLAAGLLPYAFGPPLMILSGNSVQQALLTLAALEVGLPVSPISPAYSLLSKDFGKLRVVTDTLQPALVFVEQLEGFRDALRATGLAEEQWLSAEQAPAEGRSIHSLLTSGRGDEVSEATRRVGPQTTAKILFTSGSTGLPKGVINTQQMLCSNQQAIAQCWPFVEERPPVIVDWLPWSHTFGSNHNFNMVLRNGGTLYIDDGKPMPGLVDKTVRNLKSVSSTLYFNVPKGFDMLIPYLKADADLRRTFFSQLQGIFYAGAALPNNLWNELEALSTQELSMKVPLLSAWGATETAPLATSVHFRNDDSRVIGLPAPGVELKLVPTGKKLEIRVKGPNVTSGYLGDSALTKKAFDDEGYFRTGDAVRLADPHDVNQGLIFDGRTAENFKLSSGTWVHVGQLRLQVISATAPLTADAVIAGHDRDGIGVLAFPNVAACEQLAAGEPIAQSPAIRQAIARALAEHNRKSSGSSDQVDRFVWLQEPPSIDQNEITDKGYINQQAVLANRSEEVERLFSDASLVILPEDE